MSAFKDLVREQVCVCIANEASGRHGCTRVGGTDMRLAAVERGVCQIKPWHIQYTTHFLHTAFGGCGDVLQFFWLPSVWRASSAFHRADQTQPLVCTGGTSNRNFYHAAP